MRQATTADAHLILEMLIACYIENCTKIGCNAGFDIIKTRGWIAAVIASPYAICFIADGGVIIALHTDIFWSDNQFVSGAVFYVKPEARNGLLARALFRAVEREAKSRGIKWIVFSPQYELDFHGLIPPLMYRLGSRQIGGVHGKELT